jgi:hypothetical protein
VPAAQVDVTEPATIAVEFSIRVYQHHRRNSIMTQQRDIQPNVAHDNVLEQALTALEHDRSAAISLSDSDVARIVGGAYLAAMRATVSARGVTPSAGGDDNCGPGSCHAACNSWCHDFKV